jgi:hypothetical protein
MPRGGSEPDHKRRRQVVWRRARGLTLAEIARRMDCTRQNVHERLANIGKGQPSVPGIFTAASASVDRCGTAAEKF